MVRAPGGLVTRVGKVPGNVGAVRSAGGMSDVDSALDDVVPLVVLSPGSPMSVVDNRTLGYEVLVEADVVAATCGGSGR